MRNGTVGVLALQGDFAVHLKALADRGVPARPVRRPADLEGLAGLVLPGGESTTMLRLLSTEGLRDALCATIAGGLPVLATCAGLILIARRVRAPEQESLGLLDVDLERNGYGRQIASGLYAVTGEDGLGTFPGAFIRAPRITRAGPDVRVIGRRDGEPVLVRQGSILASSFHPEMSPESPVHDHYLSLVCAQE